MAGLETLIQREIARCVRREIRAALKAIRRETTELCKRVELLDRKGAGRAAAAGSAPRVSFTGAQVEALRKRLALSQAAFADLLGISALSVYNWEKAKGALLLRSRTRTALAALATRAPSEVKQSIGSTKQKAGKKAKKKVRRVRKTEKQAAAKAVAPKKKLVAKKAKGKSRR